MASEQICQILNILAEDYDQGVYPGRNSEGLNPEWPCDPFHVLIATILSQRTRDDNTRRASDNLFHRFDSVEAIADADPDEVAELVRPAGFPKQKGKAIVDWVGRKTAACVRSYAMDIPSVCVDTHVHRISNLMGLVDTKTPEETEFALMDITPRERWSDINRYLVRHGQVVCQPNRPHCDRCRVSQFCKYYADNLR